jgi:hypothetical protein
LLDGQADRDRVRPIILRDGGIVEVISVEDMIADRMGQYGIMELRYQLTQFPNPLTNPKYATNGSKSRSL